jgi:hypothetical protein
MNGEELGFVNELLHGATEETVLSQILGSSEFYAHAQTRGFTGSANYQFVQALYQLLLNRTPSPAEVNGWVSSLGALGQQRVALAFLQSQEYRGDVVSRDYVNLLHRAGDPAAVNSWIFSNLDLGSIRMDFEATPEFFTNG